MSGTTNMVRINVVSNILLKGTGIGQKAVTSKVCIAALICDVKNKFRLGDVLVVRGWAYFQRRDN